MCIPYGQLDPKSRRILGIGNFSLPAGLLLWIFRSYIPVEQDWLHGVCGLLLGLSIGINLMMMRRQRRCGWNGDAQNPSSFPR
jgi:hypothetical protein